ncbi:MAG: hypothetical protein WC607_03115 [Candidatus Micrarchaeia archaeon]
MKCECNNKIWIIAAVCLIVGGLAGYYFSEQNNTEYVLKGAEFGCASAANAESGFCEFVSGGDYLEKATKSSGDVCPPCGCYGSGAPAGECCGNCVLRLIGD